MGARSTPVGRRAVEDQSVERDQRDEREAQNSGKGKCAQVVELNGTGNCCREITHAARDTMKCDSTVSRLLAVLWAFFVAGCDTLQSDVSSQSPKSGHARPIFEGPQGDWKRTHDGMVMGIGQMNAFVPAKEQ